MPEEAPPMPDRPPVEAVISLGSNLGDRVAYLQAAIDQLRATPGVAVAAISPVYETDPVGGVEQGDFLNIVARVRSSLSPEELLRRALVIESALDRRREVRWGPRTVDIDLIAVEGEIWNDEFLTLPHPRAHERAFVLVPWLDVDPSAVLGGTAVTDLLAGVQASGVRRRDEVRIR